MKDRSPEIFDRYINELMDHSHARCIAAKAFRRDGTVLYENYFGRMDENSSRKPDQDTIFGLASVTKSFTALSVMKLQEEGKLSVDDSISGHVPYYHDLPGLPPVRIRHFLSHSGGFFPKSRILTENVAGQLGKTDSPENELIYDSELLEEGLRLVASRLSDDHYRIAEPGKYFSYCNDGYGILSEIVREVSGYGSFAQYVENEILSPLGMERSTMSFIRPALDPNAATLYTEENGILTADRNYLNDAFVLNGGGAMKSTISDLTGYLLMYLGRGTSRDGRLILHPDSVKDMVTPRIPVSPGVSYCYGLELLRYGDVRLAIHGGSLPGVSSVIAFSPEEEIGFIILSNTMGVPVSAAAEELFSVLTSSDTGRKPLCPCRFSDEIIRDSQGIYHSDEGDEVEIRRCGDSITVLLNGKEQDFVPVSPVSGVIRKRYTDTFFEFISDRERGIFALRFGSRIFPRMKNGKLF